MTSRTPSTPCARPPAGAAYPRHRVPRDHLWRAGLRRDRRGAGTRDITACSGCPPQQLRSRRRCHRALRALRSAQPEPAWGAEHRCSRQVGHRDRRRGGGGLSTYHTRRSCRAASTRCTSTTVQAAVLLPETHAHIPPVTDDWRGAIPSASSEPGRSAPRWPRCCASGRRSSVSRDAAIVDAIRATRSSPRLPARAARALEPTGDLRRLAGEARFVIFAVTSTDVRARARASSATCSTAATSWPTRSVRWPLRFGADQRDRQGGARVSRPGLAGAGAGLPTLKIGAIAGPALPVISRGQYSSIVIASASTRW